MKTIKNEIDKDMLIKIDKIKPFYNICRVTGELEKMNIKVEYIPSDKYIELGSYREFFNGEFNEYVEHLTYKVYEKLIELLDPKYLKVEVFLEEKTLTPWSVVITNEVK